LGSAPRIVTDLDTELMPTETGSSRSPWRDGLA